MSGKGFAPKLAHANEKSTREVMASLTRLATDNVIRGHDLPDDREWPQPTRDLWESLRRSPMAAQWLPPDWCHLMDTMLLHAALWEGDTRLAGEIRLRLATFAVTPEARMRLRVMIDGMDAESAPPTKLELLMRRADEERGDVRAGMKKQRDRSAGTPR